MTKTQDEKFYYHTVQLLNYGICLILLKFDTVNLRSNLGSHFEF